MNVSGSNLCLYKLYSDMGKAIEHMNWVAHNFRYCE